MAGSGGPLTGPTSAKRALIQVRPVCSSASIGKVRVGPLEHQAETHTARVSPGGSSGWFGELAPGLRIIAGTSVLDAELRKTPESVNEGNNAPGVPGLLANANIEWDVPQLRGLTLTGRLVATGDQWVDAANSLEIDSWVRFDLGARYVTLIGQRPLTLRAGIDNVTNERYWASSFETFGTSLLQGQPRTLRLSASVDF